MEGIAGSPPGTGRRGGPANGNPGLTTVAGPPPAWEGFRPLRVTGVDRETATVTSLRLAAPDGSALPSPLAGQYLTIKLVLASGQVVVRNYSLSGPPGHSEYRISVKREPHGLASDHIHASVRVGQTIEAAAPRGTFTLAPGTGPVALVSAGVGITPVLAMLHDLAADASTRPVFWIHGAPESHRRRLRRRGPPPVDDPARCPVVDLLQLAVARRSAR